MVLGMWYQVTGIGLVRTFCAVQDLLLHLVSQGMMHAIRAFVTFTFADDTNMWDFSNTERLAAIWQNM